MESTHPTVRHYCEQGHYKHVGSCADCQRRAAERARRHLAESTRARIEWDAIRQGSIELAARFS